MKGLLAQSLSTNMHSLRFHTIAPPNGVGVLFQMPELDITSPRVPNMTIILPPLHFTLIQHPQEAP